MACGNHGRAFFVTLNMDISKITSLFKYCNITDENMNIETVHYSIIPTSWKNISLCFLDDFSGGLRNVAKINVIRKSLKCVLKIQS
jgi:hypothetical protein